MSVHIQPAGLTNFSIMQRELFNYFRRDVESRSACHGTETGTAVAAFMSDQEMTTAPGPFNAESWEGGA
jgi:hypothetical protein